MLKTRLIVLSLAFLNGLLLLGLASQYATGQLGVFSDSREYHFVAVNILEGLGYFDVPVAPREAYDEWTRAQFQDWFEASAANAGSKPLIASVNPGYPLFLAAIYQWHGVSPDMVIFYQRALVFGIGMLMLIVGWQIWRYVGAAIATLAVFLLGMNMEFSYMVEELLTETLGTFLLILSLSAALWAKRREWRAEIIVGVIFSAVVLTRPALVFAAFLYGVFLLSGAISAPRSMALRRVVAYAAPCLLLIGAWIGFASYQTGAFVPLMRGGVNTVKMGMRAETATKIITAGGSFEEVSNRTFSAELSRWLHNPATMGKVMQIKFRDSVDHLPRFLWNSILLGFALLAAMVVSPGPPLAEAGGATSIRAAPLGRGPFGTRRLVLGFILFSVLLLYAVPLGWSAPWVQFWFMGLPVLMLLARVEFAILRPGCCAVPAGEYRWILSWVLGFLAIVVLTIGDRRYMRPFLPEFYLAAAFALPLLVIWLSALLEVKSRLLNLEFEWARRV